MDGDFLGGWPFYFGGSSVVQGEGPFGRSVEVVWISLEGVPERLIVGVPFAAGVGVGGGGCLPLPESRLGPDRETRSRAPKPRRPPSRKPFPPTA